MNIPMNRTAFLAVLFAATASATITGLTVDGESHETSVAAICTSADWPMIPMDCLDGGSDRSVRIVDADLQAAEAEADAEEDDLRFRFDAAFAG
jgi:hypothetical protein